MSDFKDNRQLLCTFSKISDYEYITSEILNFYEVYNNRIFAFINTKIPNELYLTYNVLNMQRNASKFPNTILIHRKKHTNTLYTLNSLNKLIEEEHGVKDSNYQLDWDLYKNSLIITGDVSVKIIPLKIYKVKN